ncbi:glycosyltransferase [Pseudidiomarina sp. 1APP75-27a]|uniref:glycosyltransferase n=1 Tax=Pseudidiomarina terrestris TaxID=2820060 RepID=UPI002B05D665|nr:glycosyltransferase [Pseudidiomarina sp. 1APP75-27a]MEA3587668.1 glycosyltransferase [Pseudidiomarina sp. 1APP75-27a]
MKDKEKPRGNLIFVCGAFDEEKLGPLIRKSPQRASNTHQLALIKGFLNYENVDVYSLPYVGAYPKSFEEPRCNAYKVASFNGAPIFKPERARFFNFPGLRFFSRFYLLLKYLAFNKDITKRTEILVYGAHTPFLLAVVIYKKVFKPVSTSILITDLSEFMGQERSRVGLFFNLFKAVDSYFQKYLLKKFDKFVLLSELMYDRLGLCNKEFLVEEGVFDLDSLNVRNTTTEEPHKSVNHQPIFTVMYAGGLSKRNGILELVEAFVTYLPDCRLILCGYGELSSYVEKLSAQHSNVVYLGFVDQAKLFSMYPEVDVFINPRNSRSGDFVRYSFPSKTMEYLAFKKPLICYILPGMPHDYEKLVFSINGEGAKPIADAVLKVKQSRGSEIEKKTSAASQFIAEKKNSRSVVSRIISFLNIDI